MRNKTRTVSSLFYPDAAWTQWGAVRPGEGFSAALNTLRKAHVAINMITKFSVWFSSCQTIQLVPLLPSLCLRLLACVARTHEICLRPSEATLVAPVCCDGKSHLECAMSMPYAKLG